MCSCTKHLQITDTPAQLNPGFRSWGAFLQEACSPPEYASRQRTIGVMMLLSRLACDKLIKIRRPHPMFRDSDLSLSVHPDPETVCINHDNGGNGHGKSFSCTGRAPLYRNGYHRPDSGTCARDANDSAQNTTASTASLVQAVQRLC